MDHTTGRRPTRARLVVALVLLASAAASPAQAAPSTKYYSATPAAIVVPAGQDRVATLVLTSCNPCGTRTSTQPFGSAEVRYPRGAGLAETGASVASPSGAWSVTSRVDGTNVVLLLRNPGPGTAYAVAPGSSIRVSVPVSAGAPGGRVQLTTRVKQSNDFSGSGNDVTRVGPDPVVYLGAGPPHSVRISTGASTVQVDSGPVGGLVRMCPAPVVQVLDAEQHVVSWLPPTAVTLTADRPGADASSSVSAGLRTDGTVTTSAGVATFGAPAVAGACSGTRGDGSVSATVPGRAFTLRAALVHDGRTFTADDSGTFDVLPYYVPCPDDCATSGRQGGTSAAVEAVRPSGSSGGAVGAVLSFGVGYDSWDAWMQAACNPDEGVDATLLNPGREVVTVDLRDHDKTVELAWSKAAVQWATNNGSSQWRVCMAAEYAFPTDGAITQRDGWWVGALSRCSDVLATEPCVARLTRSGGQQLATVRLPDVPGDPRMI